MNKLHLLLSAALVLTACDSGNEPAKPAEDNAAAAKKPDADADKKPAPDADTKPAADTTKKPDAAANPTDAPDPAAAPAAGANSFEIVASHAKPKPTDPVTVNVGVKVVKAAFDPKNPEGGTATIELDVAGLDSKSPMRDKHLKSEDYLDVGNSPAVTVDISGVKKGASDTAYTATAKVGIRGQTAEWPIAFEIVETTDKGIRIKGTHSFDRTKLGVGKTAEEGDSVANQIEARFQLTLEPSA